MRPPGKWGQNGSWDSPFRVSVVAPKDLTWKKLEGAAAAIFRMHPHTAPGKGGIPDGRWLPAPHHPGGWAGSGEGLQENIQHRH